MPRALLFLILVVVIIAGLTIFLSSRAQEVATSPVEVDVTNEAGT